MPSSLTMVFLFIFCLESLAAMLQNGFMVTVLGRQWVRRQALSTGDTIVACIATTRFCVHGVAMLNGLLSSFDFCFLLLNIFWDFLNVFSFWLTAWLAVFYCVKISSFSHPTFFWLKWRISRAVHRLMLGSLIICSLTAISSVFGNLMVIQMIASLNACENRTLAYKIEAFQRHYFLLHEGFTLSIPFLLFLVSTVLLMVSLCRHMVRMRDRRPGLRDPSSQAHTTALKSLVFFLIFYTSYFLSLYISTMNLKLLWGHWRMAWEVFIYSGICLHSTILVLSSPKLRRALETRLPAPALRARKALEDPGRRVVPLSGYQY
nr:taste receptor type 2 member 62-like [Microcebus murinus]